MCSITQRLKCSIKHALTLTSIHALKLALELNALTQVCSSSSKRELRKPDCRKQSLLKRHDAWHRSGTAG